MKKILPENLEIFLIIKILSNLNMITLKVNIGPQNASEWHQ